MKDAIYNNPQSFDCLEKLISEDFYAGKIQSDYFELTYNAPSLISYPVKGILSQDQKRFYLKVGFNENGKFFLALIGIILLLFIFIFAMTGLWLGVILLLIFCIVFIIDRLRRFKNAKQMFIDRFYKYYYA